MKRKGNIRAALAALAMIGSMLPGMAVHPLPATANTGSGTAIAEHLDRGITAINTGAGMLVSWRFNADDADDAEVLLYRGEDLIYTSNAGLATSFLDKAGNASSQYRVDTVVNGAVVSSEQCRFTSGTSYFDIPLQSPGNGYTPNDCCAGDVDGDGQYELFLKWEAKALDNSQAGYTDKVFIDCVTLDGRTLWRVDMGVNIRAGQHYTQMCVADFDCDGKAELITKTADGTVDGTGKVIGDGSKDYRNPGGYILDGSEFMTLFDGQTGAALDTIPFPVPRGDVSKWGDKYGNRVDRFNSGIAYLDGVHPSAIYNRGYYTRMTLSAVDVVDKKLSVRWVFDSDQKGSEAAAGQGNHNLMTGDVDGDGRQEISMGDCVIDDNGTLLWSSGKGHGDAQHLADLIPERPGLELWQCHEHGPTFGVTLFDASNGQVIFHHDGDKDTGRCCADNVFAGNPGAELWGARPAKTVLDKNGSKLAGLSLSMNFLIYWDGDLERELFSGTAISKMVSTSKVDYIFNADGCESNNSTKAVPCLTADLFGDWREELVMRTADNKHLRIWCTPYTTDVRLTTLMHDTQYRTQNCCQQSAYNQPPHTSFYLGSDAPLPERPNVQVLGTETPPVPSVPAPTLPPAEPAAEPADNYHMGEVGDFIIGDVNHDGEVDVFDFALVKRELLEPTLTRQDRRRADTDADGKVGVTDLVSMQRFLHGQGGFRAVEEKRSFQYALDMSWQDGVEENSNAGFRDKAYVNLDNRQGSFLDWDVTVPEDGNYLCTFGIANGSQNNRQMKIEVNGGADFWVQDFLTTTAWTTWQERGIVLPLKAGRNVIRLTSVTDEGGPNFDYMTTEWTDEPTADVYTEPSEPEPQTLPKTNARTIWIAGDSTVQTYSASKAPQQGWGAYLGENLPDTVTVQNRAIAGRSSKSFYDNGRLDSILDAIRPGDYLLVQFGINDGAYNKAERFAPTCGTVPGTENSFEWYLQKYIEGAKAKGATPVMVTTTINLKSQKDGKFVGSYGNYCDAMKQLAGYYQIPLVDLNTLMADHYNQVGYDTAFQYHMCSTGSGDTTHFTETGARVVAKLVADEMAKQGLV